MKGLRAMLLPTEGRLLSNILKQGIFFFFVLTLADVLSELILRTYDGTGISFAGLVNECCIYRKLIMKLISGFVIATVLELVSRKR
jgi:hypothetical protein